MVRRYRYSYQTIVRYDAMVSHHHFLLRCTPMSDNHQVVIESLLQLLNSANVTKGTDQFGSEVHYGSIMQRHDIFVVSSSGMVKCSEYRVKDSTPAPYYGVQSPMTHIGEELGVWGSEISNAEPYLQQAMALSDAIHNYMSYSPGATNTLTTANQSFALKSGVCQDYAHILIGLCRERGILARYVAGLVIGTGESHAWVEIYCNGEWRGIDPTHNSLVEWGYIKLSHGRDATDCSVTRGIHRGAYNHTTEVKVVVEELF